MLKARAMNARELSRAKVRSGGSFGVTATTYVDRATAAECSRNTNPNLSALRSGASPPLDKRHDKFGFTLGMSARSPANCLGETDE